MKYFGLLLLLSASCSSGYFLKKNNFVGEIIQESMYSPSLNEEWKFNVYYPYGYSPQKSYPVIYLLHGACGIVDAWKNFGKAQKIFDKAIYNQHIPPSIVIMPDGKNSWYTDSKDIKMISAFEKDLFPYIEKNYPVINKKEARIIGGASMGGHGAITFAFRNAHYFRAAFAIAPAITKIGEAPAGALQILLRTAFKHIFDYPFNQEQWDSVGYEKSFPIYKQKNSPVKFFVATGTFDIVTPVKDSIDFVEFAKNNNIEIEFKKAKGEIHFWNFFAKMLEPSLIATKK